MSNLSQLSFDFNALKTCTRCKKGKSLDQFSRDSQNNDGYQYKCKQCAKELFDTWLEKNRQRNKDRCKQYADENPEKIRAKNERYLSDPVSRARRKEGSKRDYGKHRTARIAQMRHRAATPEFKQYQRDYLCKNRLQFRINYQNRRARIKAAGGTVTKALWRALCESYDNRCLSCGEQKPLTMDHVVALSKGGAHGIENIQPLCDFCNKSKGVQDIDYRQSPRSERELKGDL